jgi:2-polyprenyl-6-methoxyphenol hydroxylase-like FAD-dependent oxidoreductase
MDVGEIVRMPLLSTCLAAAGAIGLWVALRWAMRRFQDLTELTLLHAPVPEGAKLEHAIVMGGSWTGMLAAAVLTRYFERVTVIERDTLPVDADSSRKHRKGAPQSAQIHIIVDMGIAFVTALLPGFEAALAAAGGRQGDRGRAFGWHHRGGWRPRRALGMPMWFASRPVIEWTVRSLVLGTFRGITVMERTRILGILGGPHGTITGVRVTPLAGHDAPVVDENEQELTADLILDCTGKASRSAAWLAELGYGEVREERVDPSIQYATRFYQRPPEAVAEQGDFGLILHAPPGHPRGPHYAGALSVEDNQLVLWAVLLGRKAPKDDAEMMAFLRGLDAPEFHQLVSGPLAATPVLDDDVRVYGSGPMFRRHFHRLRRFPENFVVLGDAFCVTDPAFGLGLSLSANGISALNETLLRRSRRGRLNLRGFGKEMMGRLAWRTFFPWLLTTGEDYRFDVTVGPYKANPIIRVLQWYADRLFGLALRDAYVDREVMGVIGVISQPLRVAHPRVLWHMLRDALLGDTKRRSRAQVAPSVDVPLPPASPPP